MKKNLSHKGFTLIELLVVVAIIAILSTAVLASLNSARNKAKDARITSEVSSLRAQMELYYNSNGFSYGSATDCNTGTTAFTTLSSASTSGAKELIDALKADAGGTTSTFVNCAASTNSWVVAAKLVNGAACADSSGASKSSASSTVSSIATFTSGAEKCN